MDKHSANTTGNEVNINPVEVVSNMSPLIDWAAGQVNLAVKVEKAIPFY